MKTQLLSAATSIGPGVTTASAATSSRTLQASVDGNGAVLATVVFEGTNDGVHFVTIGTVTLSGTNTACDGFSSDAPWDSIRANVTAIAGSGATVSAAEGWLA